MSLIGKGSSSFKKKDVQEQRSIALGFKKIRFGHKATLGDTGINLTSLVAPTEMTSNGFTNPNATEIASANILTFRNNLKLISSLRGLLIDQLSYAVSSNTTIKFLGFTAEDGEIFQGWLDESPTTSLQVVDGKTIVASGVLLAGQTDFNIGTPIPLNQNPAQQIGAVMVFADRGLQYRKVGNVTGGDGDYIEVPVAGGLGSLIRFNASGVDRFITVMSNGVVAERPDGSQTAFLERVQGQVDAMIPVLSAVSGLPTTTFQTAPNDVDLKQFGDAVIENAALDEEQNARLDLLETGPTVSVLSGSGTFITPANTKWLRIRMVGAGGGGGGGGIATGGAGTPGSNTTFGSFIAGGGNGGTWGGGAFAGGTNTFSGVGFAIEGGDGQGSTYFTNGGLNIGGGGGQGGSSFFGGAGGGGTAGGAGASASPNSGGGGGGGGASSNGGNLLNAGSGGSSGGYIEAIIYSPTTLYSYSVGTGGTGGGATTAGGAGGNGANGTIIVEAYF
jgi:hypothetical protein